MSKQDIIDEIARIITRLLNINSENKYGIGELLEDTDGMLNFLEDYEPSESEVSDDPEWHAYIYVENDGSGIEVEFEDFAWCSDKMQGYETVSYTHLTLPTN